MEIVVVVVVVMARLGSEKREKTHPRSAPDQKNKVYGTT